MNKQAIQYTVRGIPPELDRVLREKAAKKGRSLNQLIIEELSAANALDRKRADFSDIAGLLQPDPLLDEILESQRQIDPDMWK